MPAKKKVEPKKAAKGRKLQIGDLETKADPKGGLNFEEVKAPQPPSTGPVTFSWGMCKPDK